MKFRRILAALLLGFFLLPLSVTATSGEILSHLTTDFLGSEFEDALVAEFQMTGFLGRLYKGLISGISNDPTQYEPETIDTLEDLIIKKLGDGSKFTVKAVTSPEERGYDYNSYVIHGVTDEEFRLVNKPSTEVYEGIEIVQDGAVRVFLSDGNLYITTSLDEAKAIINLIQGKSSTSLLTNPKFSEAFSRFVPLREFSLYLDESLLSEFSKISDGSPNLSASAEELKNLFETLSMSAGPMLNGYQFQIFMKYKEAQPEPGLFTPTLYTKFPKARVIFFSDQFNLAENREQAISRSLTIPAIFKSFGEQIGFDSDTLLNLFTKETAFAIQDTLEGPLPVVTIMADVSSDPVLAEEKARELFNVVKQELLPEGPPGSVVSRTETIGGKEFLTLLIDASRFKAYNGTKFPKVHLSMGVTNDNVFIVTTDSSLSKHYGEGLQNNADFAGMYQNRTEKVSNIMYLSIRNIFTFLERMFHYTNIEGSAEGHNVPLRTMNDFYEIVHLLYRWKDILLVTTGSDRTIEGKGFLRVDSTPAPTFEKFVSNLQLRDRDYDGVSDFTEIYQLSTDPNVSDTDGDGTSDKPEFETKTDPRNMLQQFNDVEEDEWFSHDLASVAGKNIVKGYGDGTVRPRRQVTRAEFTCMAMRAFQSDLRNFAELQEDVSILEESPKQIFLDVPADAWFSTCVTEAAEASFVRGFEGQYTGSYPTPRYFKPLSPITRAEAVTILIKMNVALQKAFSNIPYGYVIESGLPFQDVSTKDWFYGYVDTAYDEEVIEGKAPDRFDPHGFLTRAEASVMIHRALDREREMFEEAKTEGILPFQSIKKVIED